MQAGASNALARRSDVRKWWRGERPEGQLHRFACWRRRRARTAPKQRGSGRCGRGRGLQGGARAAGSICRRASIGLTLLLLANGCQNRGDRRRQVRPPCSRCWHRSPRPSAARPHGSSLRGWATGRRLRLALATDFGRRELVGGVAEEAAGDSTGANTGQDGVDGEEPAEKLGGNRSSFGCA